MNPKTAFFHHIYQHPLLSEADIHALMQAHERVDFSRGAEFSTEGQTANAYYLVESGLLRAFVHSYDGREITTGFYGEKEIAIEVSSLFQRVPASENIVSLTAGTAWKIGFDTFQKLFHQIEGFREWGRAWMANQLFLSKQRSIEFFTKSATDRYLDLIREKPGVIRHAPVKDIASWLGIADTSLSRIRKEVAHVK